MKPTILRSLLIPLSFLLVPASAAAQEVQWRLDYNSDRKEAVQKGLPLFLDIGTVNCFWCRRLDESTFRDPVVIRTLNEKFIPLKIDGDRDAWLTQALRVQSYPTLVFAASDGKILGTMESYQDAVQLQEVFQRILAGIAGPDWMARDYDTATKAVEKGDYARAVKLLRAVLEDGKQREVQKKADQLLQDVEQRATAKLTAARMMHEKGQSEQAAESLAILVRDFSGTRTAKEAADLKNAISQHAPTTAEQRAKRAKELLEQALEDHKAQQFLSCLDRCELLIARYGDLPEGGEAMRLAVEIKENPEWLQAVCDSLTDRLGGLLLAQADTWIRRGQPQQAIACLERIVQRFPNTRQAEVAQNRLNQLRGSTGTRGSDDK